jgi:hypothetical protein
MDGISKIMKQTSVQNALPYPVGAFVTVTKIARCKTPVVEPGSWEDWIVGSENNASLPVDYEMKGFLMEPVLVGGQIRLYRTHRNGIEVEGHFVSTLIVSITGSSIVETFNSIYLVVPVKVFKNKEEEL